MIVFFTAVYFVIYIYYFRLDRELGIRKIPTVFAEDKSFCLKSVLKQFLLPLCIIAAAVTGAYFALSVFSLPVFIFGTYIFSFVSRRKIREINLFDEKFTDGDKYEQ